MDELQALQALFSDPAPPAEPVLRRHREALMTIIDQATDAAGHPSGPRRRRRALKLLVVPAAALLAAAGWAVLRDEATEAAAFACLADGVTAVLPNDGTPPVDACRALWEAGSMQEGVTTAPPLAACVSDPGVVVVIAAEEPDACEADGMGTWAGQADYEAIGAAVRGALVSFHDLARATGDRCATEADWRAALGDHLDGGDEGWHLEVDRVEPDRYCFGVGSIDPTTKTVTLLGHPGDESIGCDPRTGC